MNAETLKVKFGDTIDIHMVQVSPPFSRAIGLKVGFDAAATIWPSKTTIFFSIDASIGIPSHFAAKISRSVICGVSAYAPVCWKQDSLSWVEYGYGMVGVCAADYGKLEAGWRESWWYKWGAEDVDMVQQLGEKLFVFRPHVDGYVHTGNSGTRSRNSAYYKNKNVWPFPLPVVPITTEVTDERNRQMLIDFTQKHAGTPPAAFSPIILRTPSIPYIGKTIFTLWSEDGNDVYFISIPRERDEYKQPSYRESKQRRGFLRL